MNGSVSTLPDMLASDEELGRYAGLLDRLGIALMIFTSETVPCLKNETAETLLGKAPVVWLDETGLMISDENLPVAQVFRTSQPVLDRLIVLSGNGIFAEKYKVSAFPVFSENGALRRVLLTLAECRENLSPQTDPDSFALRDPLTGVFSRNYVLFLLENEIHRARRYGTPFTLAMIDLDESLSLCEKYGKDFVKTVLAHIGKLLGKSMRDIDVPGRIGSDKFLLILPNVSLKDAMIGLERLRALVEAQEFTDKAIRVTISGGISEYTGENSSALLERCESLLVHARESGRNRLCLDLDII